MRLHLGVARWCRSPRGSLFPTQPPPLRGQQVLQQAVPPRPPSLANGVASAQSLPRPAHSGAALTKGHYAVTAHMSHVPLPARYRWPVCVRCVSSRLLLLTESPQSSQTAPHPTSSELISSAINYSPPELGCGARNLDLTRALGPRQLAWLGEWWAGARVGSSPSAPNSTCGRVAPSSQLRLGVRHCPTCPTVEAGGWAAAAQVQGCWSTLTQKKKRLHQCADTSAHPTGCWHSASPPAAGQLWWLPMESSRPP